MKKIFSKIASFAMALGLVSLAACSPETFDGIDMNNIPQADQIDVTVTVDQETNQYTLTLNNAVGYYPVWTIHTSDTKTEISTRNGYTGIIAAAGQYPVEVRLGNRNGISEGSKVYYINIENTLVDFAPYLRRLTNGESKTWQIASDKAAHLACGESGSDGTNWWSASANEKAGTGLYENRFIFTQTSATDGGDYTYDPGTSGTVYVNTGISSLPPYTDANPGDGNDYAAPAQQQDTNFQFVVEGADLYMKFPAGTLFGYIPNADAYNNPKFKVNSITNDTVELTIDNGEIAWHYILGLEGEAPFSGFKYDSEFNLWKSATIDDPWFWYAPGWSQIADPSWSLNGATYTVALSDATTDTWQAQMHLSTNISTNASTNYDFSAVLNSSLDHPHVTVKLTDANDDNVYFFSETLTLKANEDYVFYMTDMPGLDIASLKMVFDFGGNEAGTVVTVSNIVLKDHANDDGTNPPASSGDDEGGSTASGNWVDVNSDANLWNGMSYTTFFYYAPGWSQIADPGFDDNNSTYTITLPEATFDQWQAQVHMLTNISTSASKHYDMRIILNSTQDISKATIKLCEAEDDGTYYFTERVNLTAYDDYVFQAVDMEGIDINSLKLVFDFGGNPENSQVVVSGIIFQEHVD